VKKTSKVNLATAFLVGFSVGIVVERGKVEEIAETWTYPEHHERIQPEFMVLAELLKEKRWNCTGTGCVEDFSLLAQEILEQSLSFGFQPALVAGIIMVENPWMDSTAVSPAGAVGLMQVMPFHVGEWEGCGRSLENIKDSICMGLSVLRNNILLRYNGCTLKYCEDYSVKVVEKSEEF